LTLSVVEMLREATSEPIDEMTQIRVLQLILTFLDPKTTVLSKDFINSILQCCFQMFDTKSNAVKSTIQATLKTLLTLMTDTFNECCRTNGISAGKTDDCGKVELSKIYEVIYDLLQKIGFALMAFEQPA
jgi:hypothetical protein